MNPTPHVQIWSAAPTPLAADLTVDTGSVERLVEAAIKAEMTGLFLAGTCGEGPWLPDGERRHLLDAAVATAGGRLKLAVQVTDNSAARVLDNIERVAKAGVDYAIVAAPAVFMNATDDRLAAHFIEIIRSSPLPVGVYDLGRHRPITIPESRLREIYLLPQVGLVKDSSGSPDRRNIALSARTERPSLQLLNGDEFRCLDYLEAGYNGCMFGGASAVDALLLRLVRLFEAGKREEARAVDAEMKRVLFGIYGGESIKCWLTGLKYYMVRRGIFQTPASFLGYPLTPDCRAFIDDFAAAGE